MLLFKPGDGSTRLCVHTLKIQSKAGITKLVSQPFLFWVPSIACQSFHMVDRKNVETGCDIYLVDGRTDG